MWFLENFVDPFLKASTILFALVLVGIGLAILFGR